MGLLHMLAACGLPPSSSEVQENRYKCKVSTRGKWNSWLCSVCTWSETQKWLFLPCTFVGYRRDSWMFEDTNTEKAAWHLLSMHTQLRNTPACLIRCGTSVWSEVVSRPVELCSFSLQFTGQVFYVFFSITLNGHYFTPFWKRPGIFTTQAVI